MAVLNEMQKTHRNYDSELKTNMMKQKLLIKHVNTMLPQYITIVLNQIILGFISMIELSLDDISNIIGKKVKLVAEENHTYTGIVQSVDPITFSFVLVDQSDVSNEHMKVYLVNGRAIVSMEISPDELSEDVTLVNEKKIYEDFLNAFSFVYCKCQTIKKQPIMSIAEEHLADIFIGKTYWIYYLSTYCKLHLLEYCFNELELIISQHAGKKNLVTFYIDVEIFCSRTKLVHDIVWRKPNLAILYFRKALDSILMQMAKTKVAKEAVHFRLMAHQSNAPFHRQKSEMDSLLGCLITLKGAITKVSQLRLIQTRKEMKCRRCGYKFFYDASFDQCYRLTNPKSCPSPVGCGSTKFEDIITAGSPPITFCRRYQEVKLHDVNNLSNSGPLSESVVVALEEELVDSCRLGEVVLITGILCRRCQPLKKLQEPRFQIVLRATHVASAPKSQNLELAHDAIEEFKEFWSNYKQTPIVGRNVILSNFCPGMYQMYLVKLAVLLVIIGGVSRRSESGTMLRGDCHLLLIGDPGTGKSQFLKYAAKLASNSVYTTGIGTTNAGLTCSAVKEEGDWQLEAGALPLADGGICCIDEFSTMRETEKDAIREAMEQQTVSVAKAGLVTKLNCKCSIIAACNFKETVGSRSATVDCNLSSPLMSRFDVILYLRQSSDKEWCPKICAHLLYEQLASASASFRQSSVDSNPSASSLFWTFDKIKTYIKVVKSIEPSISEGAEKVLTQYFMKQRSNVNREEGLTTVRMLDSLIRLAQAHARLMFRDVVTVQDALIATIFIELTLKDLSLLVTPDPLQSVFPSDPEADYKQFEMLMLEVLGLDGQLNGADSRGLNISKFYVPCLLFRQNFFILYVCCGGSQKRIVNLARHLADRFPINKPYGFMPENLCKSDRYVMFKVGPVLCVNHGVGQGSVSIMLNELLKLLKLANCTDVIIIRIGTCGGLGLAKGTVVISDSVVNGLLEEHYEMHILGKIHLKPTKLNKTLGSKLLNIAEELNYTAVIGKTLSVNDFYEGKQARVDGALCDFTFEEKIKFLNKAYNSGVKNIEMESSCFAAFCCRAGIKAAIICVTLLDRLEGDVLNPNDPFSEWEKRPVEIISRYIEKEYFQI
ncbi:DNA helicase MCM9, partial [Trichinella pseudospiralis]